MQKWLLVSAALLLLLAGGALVWPRAAASAAAAAPAAAPGPAPRTFLPVAVQREDAGGLTLSGHVRDAAGQPLAGADVFLAASAEETLASERCEVCGEPLLSCEAHESARHVAGLLSREEGLLAPRARVRTDAGGAFRFEHLAGVSFTVWARAPGRGVASHERAAPGEPVELYLPAERTLRGEVVDDAGRPVPGARLHALSRRAPVGVSAEAGADGRFALEGLGEGPFYVLARAPGFLPAVAPSLEAGGEGAHLVLVPERTLEVRVVRGGKPVDAEVQLSADHLQRAVRTVRGLARLEGLSPGRVTVAASEGSLGSAPRTLELLQARTQVTLELEPGGRLLVTVVDEAGEPVPSARLQLRLRTGEPVRSERAEGGALVTFGPLAPGDYLLEGSAEGFADGELPARVAPGDTPLELQLARATSLAGRVLDVYGRPAPGVSVLLQPTGDTTLSDAAGRFHFAVPSAGLYTLHAHHSEWGGGSVQAQAPAQGVELSLEPRAAVEVTVTGGGERLEGAELMLWRDKEDVFHSDRASGPDGVVAMRGLPPGSYWLVATQREHLPSERQQVRVEEGQTARLSVELPRGASLSGAVVDERGQPVAGAQVGVLPRAVAATTSDAAGHFALRPLRAGVRYRLEARREGYDLTERVEGSADGEPVRLVLKRRDLFRGRVLADDGTPVKRFQLDEQEVSSADGRFEVALPRAGDQVVVSIEAPGFEPLLLERPAQEDLGDLVLKRAPTISGTVQDASGAPVSEAVVSCDVCDDSALTGADGRFTLPRPPFVPQYTLTARKGRRTASQRIARGEVPPALTLTLQPATRLWGTAYLPDGRPAAGVELEGLDTERGEPVQVVTGPDGRYSVELPPGPYRFTLEPGADFAGAPLLLVQVRGGEQHVDLGPAPGTASLTVRLQPQRGWALWAVPGQVAMTGNPPRELLQVPLGQLVYQPRGEQVTLRGLAPGHYTLVYAPFHVAAPEGPRVRGADVPSQGEVSLNP
ncbi:carboxypeptidase regulatory-like domain-containing protein [Aggregicoccus sp. 17bor-14]|uniref:carboxypeptidase-like regulatory domain-containing protein n=1 Tax=Myxococcaceae TaxID=31 RepID=UPI00129C50E2|nr:MULTISPECIES: carboxypeptidase-like regulatory domain-containing protein [Myxococcaceae]MBF5044196.1 carboxypeptidase regulatory-like domain-containing protein [Simulacricoccus sp. 17bor-14]MRI89946.1 carboxypeptidase regulatory-like domain-containing protein [Aggregicoccus sp. 17bor-14]